MVDAWFSMEYWRNDNDRGMQKISEKTLFKCNFVYHKLHMDYPGIETEPQRWDAGESWHDPWNLPRPYMSSVQKINSLYVQLLVLYFQSL